MTHFDAPTWNLAQAAAWVVYRENKLVDNLIYSTAESFAAIGMYRNMWPEHRKQHGKLSALHNMLSDGRLKAKGYHEGAPDTLAEIPAEAWSNLDLHPPRTFDHQYPRKRYEPWKDIRVKSADVKKLWRGTDECLSRTKFDWGKIRAIYEDVLKSNPDFSQNQLIEDIQLEYETKFSKEPPSRSAIQNKIKTWR